MDRSVQDVDLTLSDRACATADGWFTWALHGRNNRETAACDATRAPTTQAVRFTAMAIKAEYIWIDGTKPTAKLRSKTRVLANADKIPTWGFDGSSTNQAEGHASDRVLEPVKVVKDPI